MQPLRHWIEYLVFRVCWALLHLIPWEGRRRIGAALGALGYRVVGKRRRVALDNLAAAFPERPEAERRRIARAAFCHFGRMSAEFLTFPPIPREALDRYAVFEGLEHVERAYASGAGMIHISAHYGNWELVALFQGLLGYPMTIMTRPLDNPRLDRWFQGLRTRSGHRVTHKGSAVKASLRALGAGTGAGIVIDQNFRNRKKGVFVEFFGRPACTVPSAALLALKTGAPIIPSHSVPLPDGRYRIVYGPPVPVPEQGTKEERVQELTARCSRLLETVIRERPEYWLWLHDRWKTRPKGTPVWRSDWTVPANAPAKATG